NALHALPAADQIRIAQYVNAVPNLTRERRLSPHEVWCAGRRKLVKLPLAAAAEMLGCLPGHERPVKRGLLRWSDPMIAPDEPVAFEAVCRNGNGSRELLRDGEKYLVRVNPLMPERAFLYDASDGYLGTCRRYGRTRRDDVEALERAFGRMK